MQAGAIGALKLNLGTRSGHEVFRRRWDFDKAQGGGGGLGRGFLLGPHVLFEIAWRQPQVRGHAAIRQHYGEGCGLIP